MLLAGPVPFTSHLVCPFCLESSPARQFVRLDKFDTSANVVEVRASAAELSSLRSRP